MFDYFFKNNLCQCIWGVFIITMDIYFLILSFRQYKEPTKHFCHRFPTLIQESFLTRHFWKKIIIPLIEFMIRWKTRDMIENCIFIQNVWTLSLFIYNRPSSKNVFIEINAFLVSIACWLWCGAVRKKFLFVTSFPRVVGWPEHIKYNLRGFGNKRDVEH